MHRRSSNSRVQSFNSRNGPVVEHNIIKPNLVNQKLVQKPNGTMTIQYKIMKAEMRNARPKSINYMSPIQQQQRYNTPHSRSRLVKLSR